MIRLAAAALVLVTAFGSPAVAQDFPEFTNYVVDEARVVPDDVENAVNNELKAYQDRSGVQVAVAVVETTGNESLEDYTIDLAKEWGIGSTEEDNGVLLLIAYEDRRLRIEVGEGIEGELTDLESGRIIRDHITPLLREGDVGEAVLVGTRQIRSAIGDTEQGAVESVAPVPINRDRDGRSFGFGFFPILIFLFFILPMLRRRSRASSVFWGGGQVQRGSRSDRRRLAQQRRGRRDDDDDDGGGWLSALLLGGLLLGGGRDRGGWGGGGFGGGGGGWGGGGFGGGGGGDFGGGGASGDW